MNTKFEYMYRDYGNNKLYESIVLQGEVTEELQRRFEEALEEGKRFIPEKLDVPSISFVDAGYSHDDDIDHPWNEFYGFRKTEAPATDPRTVEEFVEQAEKIAEGRWLP